MAEKLTPQTTQGAIDCLNDFWQYGREQGFFDATYPDWRPQTLQALIDAGLTTWIHVADGRVDAVLIYHIEDMIAPDVKVPEPWMNIGYFVVRAKALGDTASRMKAFFSVADDAITEGVKTSPAVGVTAHFEQGNTDLKALLDTFPGMMWEETERLFRFWIRQADLIPKFDQYVRDTGAVAEVRGR